MAPLSETGESTAAIKATWIFVGLILENRGKKWNIQLVGISFDKSATGNKKNNSSGPDAFHSKSQSSNSVQRLGSQQGCTALLGAEYRSTVSHTTHLQVTTSPKLFESRIYYEWSKKSLVIASHKSSHVICWSSFPVSTFKSVKRGY